MFLLTLEAGPLASQTLIYQYDDLYALIRKDAFTDELMLEQLKRQIKANPALANPYYQCAKIYGRQAVLVDPLSRYNEAVALNDSAVHYYVKAKKLIDEKEFKKNKNYYEEFLTPPAGKDKLTFDLVSKKISEGIDGQIRYKQYTEGVFLSFKRTVNAYTKAQNNYMILKNRFANFNDLLLTADADLDKTVGEMETAFDSSLVYFDDYIQFSSIFKTDKKPAYKLVSVKHFPFDGIEKPDFMSETVKLWNYKAWREEIKQAIGADVQKYRGFVFARDKSLHEMLAGLAASDSVVKAPAAHPELEKLGNALEKKPLPLILFAYLESKVNFLIVQKNKSASASQSSFDEEAKKLQENSEKIAAVLDNLKKLEQAATRENLLKHHSFIATNYQNDLFKFIEKEKKEIETYYAKANGAMGDALVSKIKDLYENERYLSYHESKIPLQIFSGNILNGGSFAATDMKKAKDGSVFIAGFHVTDSTRKAFIAKTDVSGQQIQWLKHPDAHDNLGIKGRSVGALLAPTENGCALIVHSYLATESKIAQNAFIVFGNDGHELSRVPLQNKQKPTALIFDESQNYFVCVFKGYWGSSEDKPEGVYISKITAEGLQMWERNLVSVGTLAKLSATAGGYSLLFNYKELSDTKGKMFRAKTGGNPGETNSILVKMSTDGDYEHFIPFPSATSFYLTEMVEYKDGLLGLFGFTGNSSEAKSPKGVLKFINLNAKMEIQTSNLDK